MELIDAIGFVHRAVSPQSLECGEVRIVSLVPSVTELLCDLGLAPLLVGRTGFCIHPAELVAGVPKVGGTKTVNVDKIGALAPTHLIVNIDENEKPTVDRLAQFIPNVVVTHPLAPRDNLDLYRLLGGIFGASARANRLCDEFERAYRTLETLPKARTKEVLYCIWKDPWMTVSRDTYIARMLDLIGWRQWEEGGRGARYPEFEWHSASIAQVDEILLSSEPYRFMKSDVAELQRRTGKPVRLVDGEMMSWYGSRAIDGLHYLCALAKS